MWAPPGGGELLEVSYPPFWILGVHLLGGAQRAGRGRDLPGTPSATQRPTGRDQPNANHPVTYIRSCCVHGEHKVNMLNSQDFQRGALEAAFSLRAPGSS